MWKFKDFTICLGNPNPYYFVYRPVSDSHLPLYLHKKGFDTDIFQCKRLTDLYFKDIEEIEKALSVYYDSSVVLDIPRTIKEIV